MSPKHTHHSDIVPHDFLNTNNNFFPATRTETMARNRELEDWEREVARETEKGEHLILLHQLHPAKCECASPETSKCQYRACTCDDDRWLEDETWLNDQIHAATEQTVQNRRYQRQVYQNRMQQQQQQREPDNRPVINEFWTRVFYTLLYIVLLAIGKHIIVTLNKPFIAVWWALKWVWKAVVWVSGVAWKAFLRKFGYDLRR
jgi:cation transport ATPase